MSAPDYAQYLIEKFFLHPPGRPQMRTWQVERRRRTRHLIELGGLVVKSRVVDLTGDDRAVILGALLWMANKLKSNQGEQARALWAARGMIERSRGRFDIWAPTLNLTSKLNAWVSLRCTVVALSSSHRSLTVGGDP